MTRALLDTHVLLWSWTADGRLGPQARRLITDPRSEVWVSAVTIWEIVIKSGLGRLDLPKQLNVGLLDELEQDSMRLLPISGQHALAVKNLPAIHRDPFDRMLVAQAMEEKLTLLTADPVLLRYAVDSMSASA